MGGGGARAAYQVGVLRHLARIFPDLRIPFITGVSAGGINASHLGSHRGAFAEAVGELASLWSNLNTDSVFRTRGSTLARDGVRLGRMLLSGGNRASVQMRGLLDTGPLRECLEQGLGAVEGRIAGVDGNIRAGRLRALAIGTTSYSTGQSVLWVEGERVSGWDRPNRRSRSARLSVDHVMASAALPLLFPAVRIGPHWFGDGGIRLSAPLSPALHLGADRILAISTRHPRAMAAADVPTVTGYPPPAQIIGVLLNAIFLDLLDEDAYRMQRINRVLAGIPPEKRMGMRRVKLVTMRPSVDLGRLARKYEPGLPRAFRFLTRGLGTRRTKAPDFLSLVMFQSDYLSDLMRVGEEDARAREEELRALLATEENP